MYIVAFSYHRSSRAEEHTRMALLLQKNTRGELAGGFPYHLLTPRQSHLGPGAFQRRGF